MFQFFQKSIFDPNTCTLPKSPNNGFRWCPLGKLSHLGLEQLCYLILPLEATTVILLPRHLSTISATPRIQLRFLNAIIKVNKFPPWPFSTKSNTPLRRKTHASDSHRWSPLPWLCLLRWQPCEPSYRQQKRQWSDSRATSVQFWFVYILSGPERHRFNNGVTTER